MVQDFVRPDPVTPSTVGRPAGLPPPSPSELGKGAPGVSPGTLLSPAAASDASLLSPAPAAAASGISVAELNEIIIVETYCYPCLMRWWSSHPMQWEMCRAPL